MSKNNKLNLEEVFVKSLKGKKDLIEVNWYKNFGLKFDPFEKTELEVEFSKESIQELELLDLYDKEAEILINEIGVFLYNKTPKIINIIGPLGSGRTSLIFRVMKAIINAIDEYELEIVFDEAFLYLPDCIRLKKGAFGLLLQSSCIIVDNFSFSYLNRLKNYVMKGFGLIIIIWDSASWEFYKTKEVTESASILPEDISTTDIILNFENSDKISSIIRKMIDSASSEDNPNSSDIIADDTIKEVAELSINPSLTQRIIQKLYILAQANDSIIVRLKYLWDLDEFLILSQWKNHLQKENNWIIASVIDYLISKNKTRGVTFNEIQDFLTELNLEISQPTISRSIQELSSANIVEKEEPLDPTRVQEIRKKQKKGKIYHYVPHSILKHLFYIKISSEAWREVSNLTLGDICSVNSGIMINKDLVIDNITRQKFNVEDKAINSFYNTKLVKKMPISYEKTEYIYPIMINSAGLRLLNEIEVKNTYSFLNTKINITNETELSQELKISQFMENQFDKRKIIYPKARNPLQKRDYPQMISENELALETLSMITPKDGYEQYMHLVYGLLGSIYARCLRQEFQGGTPNKLKKFPLPIFNEDSSEYDELKSSVSKLESLIQKTDEEDDVTKRKEESNRLWEKIDEAILILYKVPKKKWDICRKIALRGRY